MKRILAGLAVAVAALAFAAPSGLSAPRTATIDVVFNADGSATITSTQGVSHYVVTLCDGTTFKVELSGDDNTVTVGPFSSPIASITVKSATTTSEFVNPAGCAVTPPPPPPPPECTDPKTGEPIDCPDPKKP